MTSLISVQKMKLILQKGSLNLYLCPGFQLHCMNKKDLSFRLRLMHQIWQVWKLLAFYGESVSSHQAILKGVAWYVNSLDHGSHQQKVKLPDMSRAQLYFSLVVSWKMILPSTKPSACSRTNFFFQKIIIKIIHFSARRWWFHRKSFMPIISCLDLLCKLKCELERKTTLNLHQHITVHLPLLTEENYNEVFNVG